VSVGLRNQRVRIYTYSDAGSDGFMTSTYTFSIERWGRFEVPSATESTLGGKADQKLNGQVALHKEAIVGIHDLLIVDDVQYKVVGIKPRAQEIVCDVVLADEDLALVES
jgi:hypothetical protein